MCDSERKNINCSLSITVLFNTDVRHSGNKKNVRIFRYGICNFTNTFQYVLSVMNGLRIFMEIHIIKKIVLA